MRWGTADVLDGGEVPAGVGRDEAVDGVQASVLPEQVGRGHCGEHGEAEPKEMMKRHR